MENKINVAEILKNCPQGMELDCAMYEDVKFMEVDTESDVSAMRIKRGGIKWET